MAWVRNLLLALVITCAGVPPGVSAEEYVPDGYQEADILRRPHVRIEYFWLDAVDREGLIEQLRTRGPRDFSGVPRDAFTYWKIRWRWVDQNGAPLGFEEAACEYSITVTLPRWRPLPTITVTPHLARLRERWREFTRALAEHELGHVTPIEQGFDLPCAAIREAAVRGELHSHAEAHAVAKRVLATFHDADRSYDQQTDHGRTQGARLSFEDLW